MPDIDSDDLTWQTAPEIVPDILDELPGEPSDEFRQQASDLAEPAFRDMHTTLTPKTKAAGAVYAAGLLVNEKRTQDEVAAAAGVSVGAIRNAYGTVLAVAGYDYDGVGDQDSAEDETSWAGEMLKGATITAIGWILATLLFFGLEVVGVETPEVFWETAVVVGSFYFIGGFLLFSFYLAPRIATGEIYDWH